MTGCKGQQVLEYLLLVACVLAFIVAVLGPFREYVFGLLERVLTGATQG